MGKRLGVILMSEREFCSKEKNESGFSKCKWILCVCENRM